MSQDRNPFGGLNPKGLYIPMSETEQEVLRDLIAADELEVEIHGWCTLHHPQITFGDKRLYIPFEIVFNQYATIYSLDLELRLRSGETLFRERKPVVQDGLPIVATPGFPLGLGWDIALSYMNPALVKKLKPSALGLTSRRLDKDTGEATLTGNMQMDAEQRRLAAILEQGEKLARQLDKERLEKVGKP